MSTPEGTIGTPSDTDGEQEQKYRWDEGWKKPLRDGTPAFSMPTEKSAREIVELQKITDHNVARSAEKLGVVVQPGEYYPSRYRDLGLPLHQSLDADDYDSAIDFQKEVTQKAEALIPDMRDEAIRDMEADGKELNSGSELSE